MLPFRSALVTGASSGIGEAIAHELGRAGIPTVVVARREDRLQQLVEKRKTMFEMLSTMSMKFNEMAKTALSNMRSA